MERLFRRILVPLDGSGEAESVFPYLRDLAPRFGSQVDILGVGIGGKRRRVNRLLKEYVDKVAVGLHSDSIEAKPVFLYGSAADEILDYTERNSIDLIIMATHGRGGITRWWMGSIAQKVISEARPPVLLVRSKLLEETEAVRSLPFLKILAPLDGSDIGEAALSHADKLSIETGASVILLQVIQPPGTIGATTMLVSATEDAVRAMHDAGENYLSGVAERLGEKGIKTTYEVVTGDPADKIVEYAEDKRVSLIAMSTHGRGGIARWVLGSVADKVLHGTKIPVLLVRSPRMICPRPKD
ncbi:MAG TPA: universal stress protein [Dehalococcoidia bacterium]|nr:universal stress protein [Dehalococcoidia bacterium]